MTYQGEERQFEVLGLPFAGRQWGMDDGEPVMALHGWLDNCASFDRLAPLLENVNLVALDMAGHGRTRHRSADSSYNIWEDVIEITAIADQLGWDKFSLLGHSRGAIISVLMAGTLPERIKNIALINAFFPSLTPSEEAPVQLAKAISGYLKNRERKPRYYASYEDAVVRRATGKYRLSMESAEIMATRGVSKGEDGYFWCSDRRLLLPSPMRLNEEQFNAFVDAIDCPALLFLADEDIRSMPSGMEEKLSGYEKIDSVILQGSHHMHMEKAAPEIATAINDFFHQ